MGSQARVILGLNHGVAALLGQGAVAPLPGAGVNLFQFQERLFQFREGFLSHAAKGLLNSDACFREKAAQVALGNRREDGEQLTPLVFSYRW